MSNKDPWYKTARRWGQTNLTEIDPQHYDADFWKRYWRQTNVQGVIVNAGGIVAYYPSRFPNHYRARHLGERDLFGEIVEAARSEGLAVLARMDSNRATPEFYEEHPDWFAVNAAGEPCQSQGRYMACVNSPYYKEYIPELLREIIDRYHPDGFTDNSWTGVGRRYVCHCRHCREKFPEALPQECDWDDPVYKRWIRWSYENRLENWDLNNRVCREVGGEDCLWLGMVNGNPVSSHLNCCDLEEVGRRSKIVMCDHQSRDQVNGFEQNGLNGKLLHEVAGWDVTVPESMAMYVRGPQAFRRSANPPAESRLWMAEGFAGGISPWWHHVGAMQEDRRQFHTAKPMMDWHRENAEYLYDREPVANVGILWSHQNTDFYGRHEGREKVEMPWRGFTRAMTRARIPFLPVHADHIDEAVGRFRTLILPDLAVMSDTQCDAVRRYVDAGGSIVATGMSSKLDEWGEWRGGDFALADVFGCHASGRVHGVKEAHCEDWEVQHWHSYLRLGERSDTNEKGAAKDRHSILEGFENTDIFPFGGKMQDIEAVSGAEVLATMIPPFPIYPPEFSWMRVPETGIPAIVARETESGGRVVYLAGDIDRCYGQRALPDHGELMANAIRWTVRDELPFTAEGAGEFDCHLYRQENRLVMHIVNITGANHAPGYLEENIAVGPVHARIKVPEGMSITSARNLREGKTTLEPGKREAVVNIESIEDFAVIVLG